MHIEIKDISLAPLTEAKFIKASRMTYTQNAVSRAWEVVKAHDSVAILIYHRAKEAFILVKQFRPPVYLNNQDGMTIELCAGIVDKDLSLVQIAQEEIEEECGYAVAVENIHKITSVYSAVGFAGSKQVMYYAEVDDSMKVSEGGGIENEEIEVITLPMHEAKALIYDENIAKSAGLLFAFMWFFEKEKQKPQ
ncbi:Uridine diphosphate glucose pyrophosphatase [hydrothermal vent metagenome]|uniref:Uridine diphosphate glucose pyrophosphatase n=1 Tax=hydrothermal vent metagenome TaxID=652676 RepID=A0A1W1D0X7_9ZZZZ